MPKSYANYYNLNHEIDLIPIQLETNNIVVTVGFPMKVNIDKIVMISFLHSKTTCGSCAYYILVAIVVR